MHILLIEDDQRLSENIKKLLKQQNYAVTVANTAELGLQLLGTEEYDAVILDWMLPDLEGIAVCRQIREQQNLVPLIMLTAKSQVEDKIEGLVTGADDYLTKPFAFEELLARLQAIIRRNTAIASAKIEIRDLIINTAAQTVKRGSLQIELAPREYALFEYLALHKNTVIDRIDLLHHVWGEEIDPFSNTIDVHIRYLRKKIDDPFPRKLIRTVKSKGYMVCDD